MKQMTESFLKSVYIALSIMECRTEQQVCEYFNDGNQEDLVL